MLGDALATLTRIVLWYGHELQQRKQKPKWPIQDQTTTKLKRPVTLRTYFREIVVRLQSDQALGRLKGSSPLLLHSDHEAVRQYAEIRGVSRVEAQYPVTPPSAQERGHLSAGVPIPSSAQCRCIRQ